MKNIILSTALLLNFVFSFGQNLALIKNEGSLSWTGSAALNAYSLSGSLEAKSGQLMIKEGQVESASLVIDMKSLDAENKDLRKHLRSEDFFEVKKYPEAIFILTKVSSFKEGEINLIGNLSIKDKTQQTEIPLTASKTGDKWQIKGKMILDRTKFGIYYNSPNFFDNLKGQAIADEFELEFELYFQEVSQ
ncbi:MAG: YceI family protein [Bacteroidota bacterium]